MKSLVDQRLGEIERGDAGILEEAVVEQHLVHAGAGKGLAERSGEPHPQVVGVEHGILGDLPQAIRAMAHHVAERADEHAHLAMKAFQPPNRLRRRPYRMLDQFEALVAVHEPRQRRVGGERRGKRHRAAARPAAAMRGRKGLVQVEMQRVDAKIGRPHPADDRVEIGAVAIKERAGCVDGGGDLQDLVLEEAARVRVGQHQRGDIGAKAGLQRSEVDSPARIGGDVVDRIAADRRGRRVGAVRRFRHQDAPAGIASRGQRGADRHHAAQLAMRARRRRQRHGGHAGQHLQPMRQRIDQLQRAFRRGLRLQRVQVGEAGQPRELFVEPRVVLHGARTKRVEPAVDRVVLLRQPGEMPHNLRLAEAGEADRTLPLQPAEPVFVRRRLGQVDTAMARRILLEDQWFFELQPAIAGEGFAFRCRPWMHAGCFTMRSA